ncbi:MAG: hypothetical protein ACOVP1_06785 [Bacteroidia bacterium]
MKKHMKRFFIIGFLVLAKGVQAQPEFDDEVTDTPIDTYSSILGISCLIWGMSKLEKGRKT